jgi:hypothetical protein
MGGLYPAVLFAFGAFGGFDRVLPGQRVHNAAQQSIGGFKYNNNSHTHVLRTQVGIFKKLPFLIHRTVKPAAAAEG